MQIDKAGFTRIVPLLILAVCGTADARVLPVPESYPTINAAMAESVDLDTILVNRGIYPEQLWYTDHPIVVMSHYELTYDTLDVTETVIEGYSYAHNDTASIALFLNGAADGSRLCGFTLRGAGGSGPGAFWMHGCNATVCHNLITENNCAWGPAGRIDECSGIFSGNHVLNNQFQSYGMYIGYGLYWEPVLIEDNLFEGNPLSPDAHEPGVTMGEGSRAIIRHNTFRGSTGSYQLAVSASRPQSVTLENNTFDSLSIVSPPEFFASIVWLYEVQTDLAITGNVFTNVQSSTGSVITAMAANNFRRLNLEGNVFENIAWSDTLNRWPSPAVWTDSYRLTIRNNIFRNAHGPSSGVLHFQNYGGRTPLIFEHNLFEACSVAATQPWASVIYRGAYSGDIEAHYNVFRHNYPRTVTVDDIFPDNVANFTFNYWGDPSGPYHPLLNPSGLGDVVGDSVLFNPWLTDSNILVAPDPLPPLPHEFTLEAYPNPFNPETRLKLTVAEPGRYQMELYDLLARKVQDLFEGAVVIDHEVTLSAGNLPSGIYLVRVLESRSGRPVASAKVVLLK